MICRARSKKQREEKNRKHQEVKVTLSCNITQHCNKHAKQRRSVEVIGLRSIKKRIGIDHFNSSLTPKLERELELKDLEKN